MRAPDWYPDWRHDALHELIVRQDGLKESHKAGTWPRWDYDLEAGTLTFSEDGAPRVVGDILVVGSTSDRDWQWSWANPHWPPAVVEGMEAVRAFGVEHGIEELASPFLEDDDLNGLGWAMTGVAARLLDSVGAYRAPSADHGAVFLLFKSIRFVS